MSSLQWILVAIICGTIEILSAGFWFLWLAIAALLIALGVGVHLLPNIEIQLLVFAVLCTLFIIFTRPLTLKFFKTSDTVSNIKALIGQPGVSISDISPLHYGQVKVNGEIWTAVADQDIPADTRIVVLGIDGVKLLVEAAQSEAKE